MNVAFRLDVSRAIGTGHLMRCLTLADALKAKGAVTRFIVRHIPDDFADRLRAKGHMFSMLPKARPPSSPDGLAHSLWLGASQSEDARQTLGALADDVWDWMVVDHYALDRRWESAVRKGAQHILAIDDLADRPHDCDVLLDQNLIKDGGTRYRDKVPCDAVRFLGPRYALLRKDFARLHNIVEPRAAPVKRVLVFMGGMDNGNLTAIALDGLAKLNEPSIEVDVAVGVEHPDRGAIEVDCKRLGYCCHVQTDRMPQLMAQADLSIGAAGSASWERCCLGVPTVCVAAADNQRAIAAALAASGAAVHFGDAENLSAPVLSRVLSELIGDVDRRTALSIQGMSLVDGKGTARVADALIGRS